MAYVSVNINEDINRRKEFVQYRVDKHIIPDSLMELAIKKNENLRLTSYQNFVKNYFTPNTPYDRLLLKWQTGAGKSIGLLSIAMNFIQTYKTRKAIGQSEIGTVFVIGFNDMAFKKELLRFPEFGFINRGEKKRVTKLKKIASTGGPIQMRRYKEYLAFIKKRFGNRKRNGYFKFMGYKALFNHIFRHGSDINITSLTEVEIKNHISSGKITFNKDLLAEFKNSLIICDEIHSVYNSLEKNNWGIALQIILDKEPTCRAVFASATPINNNPKEIVDLLNLLSTGEKIAKAMLFKKDDTLIPGALDKIAKMANGKISYLSDMNPKYYPRIKTMGTTLKAIDYLKFIRCPMSDFHYNTYKKTYTGHLTHGSRYIVDFVVENPDDPNIGIYQSSVVKSRLNSASVAWKSKYGFGMKNGRIIGRALQAKSLKKYSAKYAKMLEDTIDVIKSKGGKIFIYHNLVHMSGVLFIEQVLSENGFIGEFSAASDNTYCSICGKCRSEHSQMEVMGGDEKIKTIKITTSKGQEVHLVNTYDIPTDVVKGENIDEFMKKLPRVNVVLRVPNYATSLAAKLNEKKVPLERQTESYAEYYIKTVIGGKPHKKSNKKSNEKLNKKSNDKFTHRFKPVRFVSVHGEIDKAQMLHSLEKINAPSNANGEDYMILIGSKVMKESHDIKAIRNVFVMSRPDNIPALIQVRGRAIRKGSHRDLPHEKQDVMVKIYTTCLPVRQKFGPDKGQYELSYEEEKYAEKIKAFKIIQSIEKTLHEVAVDAHINRNMIEGTPAGEKDTLASFSFNPRFKLGRPKSMTTFNIYHQEEEISTIIYMIKRFFIEVSSVWTHNDLFQSIKKDALAFQPTIDTKILSYSSFCLAINNLLYDEHSSQTYDDEQLEKGEVIDKLFDGDDKIISVPPGINCAIVPMIDGSTQYYIMFPLKSDGTPNIDIESCFRISKKTITNNISINNFIQNKLVDFDYDDKKKIFYRKYVSTELENMEEVVCDYGAEFHIKFLEECIQYVFSIWTDPSIKMEKYHEFYFKMLYYYDILSFVMWVNTSKEKVAKKYIKYHRGRIINKKETLTKSIEKYGKISQTQSDVSSDGIVNLIKSSIDRTSNVWVPRKFREQYNEILRKTNELFVHNKKIKNAKKPTPDLLPVGHFMGEFPRIYHPDEGWYEDPTYIMSKIKYVENDIIIGYDEKSKAGVHVRFKLRNPIHNIKKFKDTRMIEKGTVCRSKSKEYLEKIAKKINVIVPKKYNVENLCAMIKQKLMRLEMKERIKGSNIKYFYFHYEKQMSD